MHHKCDEEGSYVDIQYRKTRLLEAAAPVYLASLQGYNNWKDWRIFSMGENGENIE